MRKTLLVPLAYALAMISACQRSANNDLHSALPDFQCQVLVSQGHGELLSIDCLASGESPRARGRLCGDNEYVSGISNPSSSGSFAALVGTFEEKYRIELRSIGGAALKVLESTDGNPMWNHDTGWNLALSSDAKFATWCTGTTTVQLDAGREAYAGAIRIYDCDGARPSDVTIRALDERMEWSRDGSHLYFTELVSRTSVEEATSITKLPNADNQDQLGFSAWNYVPIIVDHERKSGANTRLCIGSRPVIVDHDRMVIHGADGRPWEFERSKKSLRALHIPGVVAPGVIRAFNGNALLCHSVLRPGAGGDSTFPEPTKGGRGIVEWTFSNDSVRVVASGMDPRWPVSP